MSLAPLFLRWVLLVSLVGLSFPPRARAQSDSSPQVRRVEPPDWWPGQTLNPVRLLVSGNGFRRASVISAHDELTIGRVRVNPRGTALFVDVSIRPQSPPGQYSLTLQTPGGEASIPFSLLKPLSPDGRFQGITPDDVIYLLMPDRFANGDPSNDSPAEAPGLHDRGRARYYHGGDLQGVIDHLRYIKDLGATAIWMNPIYDNVDHLNAKEVYQDGPITDYHGYGAVDFYAVDEHLGDLDLLKRLVDDAHLVGLKVVQDQVANHSGPYHRWVEDPPTPNWFHGTAQDHLANTWQTWTLADPYASLQLQRETLDGWFIDILPDLNQDDDEVARYLIQNSLWWVGRTGLDAIRQDTLPYVPRSFWHRWVEALQAEYPRVNVIGEFFDADPALVSFFQGGRSGFDGIDTRIDALFDFPLNDALEKVFAQGRPMMELANIFAHDRLYPDPSRLVTFVDLHDTPRFISRAGADSSALKLAYALIFTTRGIPLIYYGSEIGLAGGRDPDNRRDFPGGWPADARNAFRASGRTPQENDVFSYLRRLTRLRREQALLRRGDLINLRVDERTYLFARTDQNDAVLVTFNTATSPRQVEVEVAELGWSDGVALRDILGKGTPVRVADGRAVLTLRPRSAGLYLPAGSSKTMSR